jgi:hypothetical protein
MTDYCGNYFCKPKKIEYAGNNEEINGSNFYSRIFMALIFNGRAGL